MNTIDIERLDLKCRGIPATTAQTALRELRLALPRHLSNDGAATDNLAERAGAATIRVSRDVTSTALADAIAARVARSIRTHADLTTTPRGVGPHESSRKKIGKS
jgi:hypothetical protein